MDVKLEVVDSPPAAPSRKGIRFLDELGRGTATWDGAAIAHSVVHHLVAHSKCRALFATHYHDLVASWAGHADVQLGHMDCLVDPESDTVVFLYLGLSVPAKTRDWTHDYSHALTIWAILACLAGRALHVYPLSVAINRGAARAREARRRASVTRRAILVRAVLVLRLVNDEPTRPQAPPRRHRPR